MGKTVIVTGGAIRIGREICLKLSEEGYNIAIHYRNSEDDARDLQEEIQSAEECVYHPMRFERSSFR